MPLLFVYGTLKRGYRLHHHLDGAPCLGAAKTASGYALFRIEWYPAMVAERNGLGVTGELFEVSPQGLAVLDDVEGAPDLFYRVEIDLVELEGKPVRQRCQAYLYRPPVTGRLRIDAGAW